MNVFSYIISLGASVMMPILFTIIGVCIGMKFGKALKSGLYVGVGFVGLGIVTSLLTTNFSDPLTAISQIYHLQLNVFDMGWPAAAAVAYNTAVGALIIPICLGINFLMLIPIVNIILLIVWAFGGSRQRSLQTWARAKLILLLISILITVAVIVILIVTGVNVSDMMRNGRYY